jgi:hypothetical protein
VKALRFDTAQPSMLAPTWGFTEHTRIIPEPLYWMHRDLLELGMLRIEQPVVFAHR